MSQVGRDHGLMLNAGAKAEDGFLIVNLWPSKEGSEAAARDPRRLGVLERTEIRPDQIRRPAGPLPPRRAPTSPGKPRGPRA